MENGYLYAVTAPVSLMFNGDSSINGWKDAMVIKKSHKIFAALFLF
jgi:hypothetical protein